MASIQNVSHTPLPTATLSWQQKLQQRVLFLLKQEPNSAHLSEAVLRTTVTTLIDQALKEIAPPISTPHIYEKQKQRLLDELLGLGPLEALLKDESITEIMVNHYEEVYVERAGVLALHPLTFSSEHTLRNIVERIVAPLGRRIDEACPIVDARLPDGSRVHAIIPPLSLRGTALTIRKFPKKPIDVHAMIASSTLNQSLLEYLNTAISEHKNIIISGGTSTGKTTLLNLLAQFIPDKTRVITIEEADELQLQHAHLIRLEARPPNTEGKGEITVRELLRNALRMRPDRIIIGECRGGEALDILQAMNTGHAGSLTTLHANSPLDALTRLETMSMMANIPLPLAAIRAQIASAIDIVIHMQRCQNGQRIVSAVHQLCDLKEGTFLTQPLFQSTNRTAQTRHVH